MADSGTSERPDGLLWRIARLHPGALWALYIAVIFIGDILIRPVEEFSAVVIVIGVLIFLPWWSYPLFAVAFLSRAFTSSSPKRLPRVIKVSAFVGLWVAVSTLFGFMVLVGSVDELPGVKTALDISVVPLFAALIYLWTAASLELVQAEKGSAYSGKHVVGAFLLFFYLPFFGIYFLHRRIRRLVCDLENPDSRSRQLPVERLVLAPMKSGHLSLELTEIPDWRSFEHYANELLRRLDGRLIRKSSGVYGHIWSVEIETVPLQLVHDDYPNLICLESDSYPGDMLLRKLHKQLSPPAST